MQCIPLGSSWLVLPSSQWSGFFQSVAESVHTADFWSGGLGEKPVSMAEIHEIHHFSDQTPVLTTKIVIVGRADQLRPEAANALLKLLEEPPAYLSVVLISESNYLLPTVKSRVQKLSLQNTSIDGIFENTFFEQWQHLLTSLQCTDPTDCKRAKELLMYQPLLHSTIQQAVVLEGFSKP